MDLFITAVRCRFAPSHYTEILEKYQDGGYVITPVRDYFDKKTHDKQVLLRHDVDMSLDYALDMALLEKDMGIKATYYILLQSGLYNPLSPEGTELVRAIKAAGHEIALHVDSRYFLGTIEFDILATIAGSNIVTWARHLINQTPIMNGIAHNATDIPYKYVSDSAMHYREGCHCTQVNKYDRLQILVHPEWTMASEDGLLNKWEIMDKLNVSRRLQIDKSFRQFRDLVYDTPPYILELKPNA